VAAIDTTFHPRAHVAASASKSSATTTSDEPKRSAPSLARAAAAAAASYLDSPSVGSPFAQQQQIPSLSNFAGTTPFVQQPGDFNAPIPDVTAFAWMSALSPETRQLIQAELSAKAKSTTSNPAVPQLSPCQPLASGPPRFGVELSTPNTVLSDCKRPAKSMTKSQEEQHTFEPMSKENEKQQSLRRR